MLVGTLYYQTLIVFGVHQLEGMLKKLLWDAKSTFTPKLPCSEIIIYFDFRSLSSRSSLKPDGTDSSLRSSHSMTFDEQKKDDMISEMDSISMIGAEREQVLGERMRSIVTSFRSRVTSVKNRLEQPPSPDENILR